MNILFIDTSLPMPDRASADLRMFTILELLAGQGHQCHYFVINYTLLSKKVAPTDLIRYRKSLEELGIHIHTQNLDRALLSNDFDAIYFKYFYPAEKTIDSVRLLQPNARIVVDSVDIVYARLFSKAKLENNADYYVEAECIKNRELATYAQADLIVTITPEDTDILLQDLPDINTFIIPNIHEIHASDGEKTPFPSLIFIGIFSHEPNVDAVLYFYHEIWPKIIKNHPDSHWFIIGGKPPPEIQSLACRNIEVTGYVPETLPYLKKSWISIAPLRFGAGMKGKVGEAMAAGIPVVTTDFGAQGLDVINGEQLLVASTADEYAEQVNNLIVDSEKRKYIGDQGLLFIQSHYSTQAVNIILNTFINKLEKLPIKHTSVCSKFYRFYTNLKLLLDQHILWRFKENKI
jgi:glycosyltransferase involved in cell wall biosynthesis